ncbi:hypothetical protein [uncultured Shewanella sp.]|uniref:hypothetical protein n=1 Tax=uncultured Shewanella sp. TaxID=173975 RepID=UPI0037042B13
MNKALPLIFVMCASLTTACATVNKKQVVATAQPATAISATQAEAALNTKSLKRKVAIGRFTNETTCGQGFFIDEDNNRIGKQAMDILSSKLFQTGKFIMLE